MSRPKPTVLLSHMSSNGKIEQVLAAEAVFAVFYDGEPINIKIMASHLDFSGVKYKKSSYPSAAHAHNLAARLNALYKTEKFTVHKLIGGEVVSEDSSE